MTEWLLFGSLVGVVSSFIDTRSSGGMLGAVIVGITGAVIGGMMSTLLFGEVGRLSFSFFIAITFAMILLIISRALKKI